LKDLNLPETDTNLSFVYAKEKNALYGFLSGWQI
jgi:hypothetical protein